jgi:ABC-2 type transport system ATP-binding protein
MNQPIIQLTQVSAYYRARRQHVQALKQVDLAVQPGEIFGLLGPNGAGKTTLLSCIEGLHPYEGTITVDGLDVRQHTHQVKRKLGIQLQRSALISNLTAAELVRTYAALYEVYLDRRQIMALLAQVQLTEQANALARQMSGGQQQRLALALAMANDPQIALLDEPTEALDPAARRAIWDIVRAFCQRGRTVLITTHSMEEAETICGRVAILDRGRVVACDTPARLIAHAGLHPTLRVKLDAPLDQVRRLEGVFAARYAGEYLEVETAHPEHTLQALSALAATNGRGVADFSVRQPNLEDVYLKLVGTPLQAQS